jgi:hypothetical protein
MASLPRNGGLSPNYGHQVHRDLIEQPELETLPSHRAGGERHDPVPGGLLDLRTAASTPPVTKWNEVRHPGFVEAGLSDGWWVRG